MDIWSQCCVDTRDVSSEEAVRLSFVAVLGEVAKCEAKFSFPRKLGEDVATTNSHRCSVSVPEIRQL